MYLWKYYYEEGSTTGVTLGLRQASCTVGWEVHDTQREYKASEIYVITVISVPIMEILVISEQKLKF